MKWLIDHNNLTLTFNMCKHQTLPLMERPPLKLNINSNNTLVAINTPIPVPLHWQEEVKSGLDRNVRLGVLEPVPVGVPDHSCPCLQKDDFMEKEDAWDGYHSIPIRESDCHYTTFIPPLGCYQ